MNKKRLFLKGMKLAKRKNYNKAIQYFNRAIKRDPNDAEAYSERGVARFHLRDLKGALEDMNKSLILEPQNPYRYASRAYIRAQCGDNLGAIDDYRQSLQLDPGNAITHNNLSFLEEKVSYLGGAGQRKPLITPVDRFQSAEIEGIDWKFIDRKVEDMLRDLSIHTEPGEYENSIWKYLKSLIFSSEHRKDYLKYLRNLLRTGKG